MKRYQTIGEACQLLDLKPHVLRYWEKEFAQISPKKRGTRRYYRPDDIATIRRVRDMLYEQGYTIEGARRKLQSDGAHTASTFEFQRELKQLKQRLLHLHERLKV